jgi:large subunit ribosomal protein L10
MDRNQKTQSVEELKGIFAEAGAVVVAHYSGLTVAQMNDLRSRMRAAGASFKVAKNRLAKRALEGTPAAGISDLLNGPTGIAYSADPVVAPKVLVAYAKENDKLEILGGAAIGSVLNVEGIKTLAELPSLDALRGKLIGLVQAPATKIAGVLAAPAGQVARVLSAYASKEAA